MINQERLVNTFLDLVQIDSPSGGEKEIAEYVADKFRAMGMEPQIDPMYNVTARLEGNSAGKRGTRGKPLFLNAHTDNVHPAQGIKPIVEDGKIRSDGTTVLGADDLAGVAAILEAVQSIVEDNAKHLPLEIAITSQEEIGLVGAKALDLSAFKAKEGLVLDSDGPVGGITMASPTHNLIEATIIGKAAHSGVAPEEGVNAIKVAAEAIHNMKLGRIDKETTANIGIIRGGAARNIVPDRVELVGEARSRNPKKMERQTKAMKKALEKAAKAEGAKVEIKIERAYNLYKHSKNDRLVKRVANAVRKIGRKPIYKVTGGGSDANIWNAKGIRTVVTSVGYEQIHTTSEFQPIAELVKAAELVVAMASG